MPADYQQEYTGKSQVLQLLLFMITLLVKKSLFHQQYFTKCVRRP